MMIVKQLWVFGAEGSCSGWKSEDVVVGWVGDGVKRASLKDFFFVD